MCNSPHQPKRDTLLSLDILKSWIFPLLSHQVSSFMLHCGSELQYNVIEDNHNLTSLILKTFLPYISFFLCGSSLSENRCKGTNVFAHSQTFLNKNRENTHHFDLYQNGGKKRKHGVAARQNGRSV